MMNEPQGRSVGPDELHDPLGPAATRALPAPPNDRHLARRLFGTGPLTLSASGEYADGFCGFFVAKANTEFLNNPLKVVIAQHRNRVTPIDGGRTVKRFLFVMPFLLFALQTVPATAGGTIGWPGWTGGADAVQVAQVIPANDLIERLSATEERSKDGTRGPCRGLCVEALPATPPTVRFSNVEFAFGSAELTDSARAQLDELGKALVSDELSPYDFRISGHTDATGTEQFNLGLSERRANSVRDYLIRNYAIGGERLVAIGLGETAPAVPSDPFDPSNRRVEITNTSTGG